MTAPLKVIAVSGGAFRPSRTQVLAETILAELGRHLAIHSQVVSLAERGIL